MLTILLQRNFNVWSKEILTRENTWVTGVVHTPHMSVGNKQFVFGVSL